MSTLEQLDFQGFPKMARWSRDVVVTEKIDGTNAQICIAEDGEGMLIGSRTRWITPAEDNYGFARWCAEHHDELLTLGPGRHFGEWWGSGIQRAYGLACKKFSLFNTSRWVSRLDGGEFPCDPPEGMQYAPACCDVVPVLYKGPLVPGLMEMYIAELTHFGSEAAPGYKDPEGVVMFHTAGNLFFKKTIKRDEVPKQLLKGLK